MGGLDLGAKIALSVLVCGLSVSLPSCDVGSVVLLLAVW